MEKISAVYKIVNTVTGDFYVGSSKDVKWRWSQHKSPSAWKKYPNSLLYKDFQKYGLENFRFQILAPVMPEYLKQVEQEFIEMLHPTYNNYRAKGQNIERYKNADRKYRQSVKWKEIQRKANKKYFETNKGKEACRKANKKYLNQPCLYNGKELTLNALRSRFSRAGVEHPFAEARKYLIKGAN